MAVATTTYRNQWATLQLFFQGPRPVPLGPVWEQIKASILSAWETPQPAVNLQRINVVEVVSPEVLRRREAGLVSEIEFREYKIRGGIYDGRSASANDRYVTVYRINLRRRDQRSVTRQMVGSLTNAIRRTVRPIPDTTLAIRSVPYGQRFRPDFGVPAVPQLPPERVAPRRPVYRLPEVVYDGEEPEEPKKPIWPWLLGGAAVLLLLTQLGKKRR